MSCYDLTSKQLITVFTFSSIVYGTRLTPIFSRIPHFFRRVTQRLRTYFSTAFFMWKFFHSIFLRKFFGKIFFCRNFFTEFFLQNLFLTLTLKFFFKNFLIFLTLKFFVNNPNFAPTFCGCSA